MLSVALVWSVLLLPGQEDAAPAPMAEIKVGERVTGTLAATDPPLTGHGPANRYGFVAGANGKVTIALESFDFDAFLRVETEAGEKLAEDNNGGVETNARVVLETQEGARYRIVMAAAAKEGAGEFTLSVAAGTVSRPSGAALLDAGIEYRRTAAERALTRGDKKAAMQHRLQEGHRRYDRSQFSGAKTAYESSLALARELGDRAGEAAALGNLGNVYHSLGDCAQAREHHEKSLALARELQDRAGEAKALGNLGNVYGSLGAYGQAREHYEKWLALARELGDRAGEVAALWGLGGVHFSVGDYAQAREHYEKQFVLAREQGDRTGEAAALGNLGNVYFSLGDYAQAREHHEKQLVLARELQDRAREATALGGLGLVYGSLGDYAQAREHHEKCLALLRKLGDRVGEARALGNLGVVYKSLGDYAQAREHSEECLVLARKLGDRAGEAKSLGNLGVVYNSLGDYRQAREHHEKCLALARELGDRAGEAKALGGLGLVYSSLGDYGQAREHHERCLALARELGDRAGEAKSLGNLGLVYRSLGDYGQAREHHEKCLALARELRDGAGEAAALGNLGNVYGSLGDYAQAREHFEKSLALARELKDRAGEARALGSLGLVYHSLGDYSKASELAQRALDRWRGMGVEEEQLYPLLLLARLALGQRDSPAALEALRRGEKLLERPSVRSLETGAAAGLRSRFSEWGEVAQELTALSISEAGSKGSARSRMVTEGFQAAGRWKGRALLEGIVEHRRGGRSARALWLRRERRELLAHRDRVLERVSEGIRTGKPSAEVEGLRTEARSLAERADDASRRLRESAPREAALEAPVGVEPEAVRRVLGKGTALFEYVEGETKLYAYVLTGTDLAFVELGSREEIGKAVQGFLKRIGDPNDLGTVAEVARLGRALHGRLLAPLLDRAGPGMERLVVVPTTGLAALPFEALVLGTRGPEQGSFEDLDFVLERYEVLYAPSSPVLVELAGLGPRKEAGKVLILADPVYPAERVEAAASGPGGPPTTPFGWNGHRGRPKPGVWPRLLKTRPEALALGRLLWDPKDERTGAALTKLAEQRSGSLSSPTFDLHLGAASSRARLLGDLKPYGVLHLAAHGYLDNEFPQQSGLVLSGKAEEVFFTIGDALELDLDADLVVLSACETARGEAVLGEGVQSLARAFLHAGARAVVASLWQVADWAAAETMEGFYREGVKKRASPAEALRGAKLALRRSRELRGVGGVAGGKAEGARLESGHPYFWAPFIYVGLPR